MAQEDNDDLPDTPSLILPQLDHVPSKDQPSRASDRAIESVLHKCGDTSGYCQVNAAINPTQIEDEEVQFVFSVPRRKRKKRKRLASPYNLSSSIQGPEILTCPPNSTPSFSSTSSQIIRRGSTGMVQQLESHHIRGNMHSSAKSGSLPTIARVPPPHLASYQSMSGVPPDLQSALVIPFTDGLQWWDIQMPHPQRSGSFQFDICGMPFAEEVLKKRKHEEEPENSAFAAPSRLSQCWYNQRVATQTNHLTAPDGKRPGGMSEGSANGSASSNFESSTSVAQYPTTPGLPVPSSLPTNFIPCENVPTFSRDIHMMKELERQSHRQTAWQTSSSTERCQNDWTHPQTTQIPVSLVPELSVSPRTTTIQVFRPLDPSQPRSQNMSSQAAATAGPTPLATLSEQSTVSVNAPLNCHEIGHSAPDPTQNRYPTLTAPSDVLRKPSLYRIPPWPSPQYVSDKLSDMRNRAPQGSPVQAQSSATRETFRPTTADNTCTQRAQHVETTSYTANNAAPASSSNCQAEMSHLVPCTGHPQASPSMGKPSPNMNSHSYTKPRSNQINQSTRMHSPNLIVDIAETCQEKFPFAAVAERHSQPIQKVFDAFSAIIQLPLLRSAADNRRHGDLAKTRMKEFRDARKAMEKAQEQERKRVLREAGRAGGGDLTAQKRSKRAPELLKAAILNNAKNKDGERGS